MRCLPAVLCALFAAPASAAPPAQPGCTALTQTWQSVELACPLEAAAPRRWRFAADFSGSHDDTELSLTPTLDGKPLACEPGSKTESNGEDGEVMLECRIALPPSAGGALRMQLRWYHATYLGHHFAALQAAP